MIHAALAQANRYAGLHPLLPTAFRWLRDATPDSLQDGWHEIVAGRLGVFLESGLTAPASEKRFESHRANIDLQVVLRGAHAMAWADAERLGVVEPFRPDGDIQFHAAPPSESPGSLVHVDVGEFVLFFPEDAHKPSCTPVGSPGPVSYRKALFKLAVETETGRHTQAP